VLKAQLGRRLSAQAADRRFFYGYRSAVPVV